MLVTTATSVTTPLLCKYCQPYAPGAREKKEKKRCFCSFSRADFGGRRHTGGREEEGTAERDLQITVYLKMPLPLIVEWLPFSIYGTPNLRF
jgi:hypothetical protein